MTNTLLFKLEEEASERGLLLRLQVRRPFNLWTLRLVVAQYINAEKIKILGEMKAWAYPRPSGLQLDTMTVSKTSPAGVGHLVWAATMAWALENTPCRNARLLAIHDEKYQHLRLIRYFSRRGFSSVRQIGASPQDLVLRMVWGGAGSLMVGECQEILVRSSKLWSLTK